MTICVSFSGMTLEKDRTTCKKTDVFNNLKREEYMASHYFDPVSNEMYSFFEEKENETWVNEHDPSLSFFRYRLRVGGKLEHNMPWERTKKRNVFYRKKGSKENYTFIGTALDERRDSGQFEWLVFDLR